MASGHHDGKLRLWSLKGLQDPQANPCVKTFGDKNNREAIDSVAFDSNNRVVTLS